MEFAHLSFILDHDLIDCEVLTLFKNPEFVDNKENRILIKLRAL